MLKNYIKIAIRNLTKNPTFSMIHILGASQSGIMALMSGSFVKLLAIANLVAIPAIITSASSGLAVFPTG